MKNWNRLPVNAVAPGTMPANGTSQTWLEELARRLSR